MPSVLQDWVQELGLRHQGVLLTAVRGCDTAPKNDPSKAFTRMLRGSYLNSHCGDAAKAQTFIESPYDGAVQQYVFTTLSARFETFIKNCDHYPHHYNMHVMHAIEIIGYYHPDEALRALFHGFYVRFCVGLHVNPETKPQLDRRLNADEDTFGKLDRL